MQRSKNDVWVGLFVLIGLAAVLFLALKSANLLQFNWSKDYTVTAKFDNIGGLKKGAAARTFNLTTKATKPKSAWRCKTNTHFPKTVL
ncbi:MAG: putative phospholipid transporter-binding protein MlaD [Pseudomonadota bacterium]